MSGIRALPLEDASGFQRELAEGVRLYMVDRLLPGADGDDERCLERIEANAAKDGLVPFKVGFVERETYLGRVRTLAGLAA
jgi:hypothetical protein